MDELRVYIFTATTRLATIVDESVLVYTAGWSAGGIAGRLVIDKLLNKL
jgi:hypothetical protein